MEEEIGLRLPTSDEMGPLEGWESSNVFQSSKTLRSYVSGYPESSRLRVAYFIRVLDGHLMAKVWFGPETQGPPGHAHGGSMASVLDEVMGGACWVAGHCVVAAEITIRFRKMLPLGSLVIAEGWVEEVDGRKVKGMGRLFDGLGNVFAEGEGLFITLPRERLQQLANQTVDTAIPCW